MMEWTSEPIIRRTARRRMCALGAAAALALSAGLSMGGCNDDFDEFRSAAGPQLEAGVDALFDAAGPQLEAGVDALFDGLIDGIFAVVEPDASTETAP